MEGRPKRIRRGAGGDGVQTGQCEHAGPEGAHTAVWLITRKRTTPRAVGAADHTPPSEEFIKTSPALSGIPRTLEMGRHKSPFLPLQLSQNLFFLHGTSVATASQTSHPTDTGGQRSGSFRVSAYMCRLPLTKFGSQLKWLPFRMPPQHGTSFSLTLDAGSYASGE